MSLRLRGRRAWASRAGGVVVLACGGVACIGMISSLPCVCVAQSAQQADGVAPAADVPVLRQRAGADAAKLRGERVELVATGHTSLPAEAEGEYPYDHAGDTVEIYFDGGLLHGYMTQADPNSQHAAPVTYDFATTHADGSAVEWTTRRVHDRWFSFAGHVERGTVASAGQAGYYLLTGTLTEHTGKTEGDARTVSLKRSATDEASQP